MKTADKLWPLIYLADLQYGKLPAAREHCHAAAKATGEEAAVRNDLQFVFKSPFWFLGQLGTAIGFRGAERSTKEDELEKTWRTVSPGAKRKCGGGREGMFSLQRKGGGLLKVLLKSEIFGCNFF